MIKTVLNDDEVKDTPIIVSNGETSKLVYNGAPFVNATRSAPWIDSISPFKKLTFNDSNYGEIVCGKVSMNNPFIFTGSYTTPQGIKGQSQSIWYFNKTKTYGSNGSYFDFSKSCLPNCVGWAGGRIRELYYLINNEFLGAINVDLFSPIGWKNHLPNTKIPGTNESQWRLLGSNESPMPGCVCIWSADNFSHIAFVEAVFNAGTDKEYCIISQSAYSNDKTHTTESDPPVTVNIIRKSNNWKYYNNCKFEYFIRTCCCDLIDAAGFINVEVNEHELTEEELEKLRQMQLQTKNQILTGDYVELQWIGNEFSDGTGVNINKIGTRGWVTNIISGAQYQYEVSRDQLGTEVLGYFDQSGVKKWV